jgi:tRNA 2-selenouridine synthase
MAIQKIGIDDFVQTADSQIIIDVRSPSEYNHAHIPGAISLPLFDNEQRAIVGTTYKKQSREDAIKIALPMFGTKMLSMVEEIEKQVQDFQEKNDGNKPILFVHCWRGGMRSAAVAWLLDLYGYKVAQLIGGYKAYRNWVIAQYSFPYQIKVLGGYTGSGKTEILHALQSMGENIIDLEGLAKHKGSSFGALGQESQPSQEMFENLLGIALYNMNDKTACLWVEDESQRIGTVMVPIIFFNLMRDSDCYFLQIPFEERLHFIMNQYGVFSKEDLFAATLRIQKRLGGLETKNAVTFIEESNIKDAFSILLKYYDKWYMKFSQPNGKPKLHLNPVEAPTVNPIYNAKLLLDLNS